MLIKLEVLEAIKRGDISLQFRRWRRRSVKPGGTLKTRVGVLSIGAITPIHAADVSAGDAQRAGFDDVPDFLKWLDTMKTGDLDRIEVSYLGEDPLVALREKTDLSGAELDNIAEKLDAMDKVKNGTPWTAQAMNLIAQYPGRLAEELAREMHLEKQVFKIRIQKLKALGLAHSLEVGYQLSPRGEKVHTHRRAK